MVTKTHKKEEAIKRGEAIIMVAKEPQGKIKIRGKMNTIVTEEVAMLVKLIHQCT